MQTPQHGALVPERLVFNSSVEALLIRGVGNQLTPQLTAELRKLGIDLKKLAPAYDSATWQKAVDLLAAGLFPGVPMAQAQWKLGESTVYGFEQTMFGKAVIALSKVIGPRRVMQRFPQTSRSSNNYSTMEARELGPTEFELTAHPYEGYPEFVQGCLRAVIDVSGGKDPKVELVSHDRAAERLVLRASWS